MAHSIVVTSGQTHGWQWIIAKREGGPPLMDPMKRLKAIVWLVVFMVALAWLMSRLLQSRLQP